MSKNYFLKDDGSFIIKDYNITHPFSNFLPGIAGAWGIPLWVFYINRAQGIISFGINDKDYSITEFFPASKAHWLVNSVGFRTFLKINNRIYYEPFLPAGRQGRDLSGYKTMQEMIIKSASLEIREMNPHLGLSFSVKYFTLPNSPLGALVRELCVKNESQQSVNLDILDGLPRIIPFGSKHYFLKDLARTLEAWMRSFILSNYAIFRLVVDPKDVSETKYIEGANFNYSLYEDRGKVLFPYLIVDPDTIFGEDKSYTLAMRFFNKDFKVPLAQVTCGKTPCSFSYFKWNLAPGESKVFYSIFGSSFKSELIKKVVSSLTPKSISEKEKENEAIIEQIKNNALCVSGIKEFNHYIKCTYLDNVLRGGYPYKFDDKCIHYIFSRKHGDLERDYNIFRLLPSYFSEGEAAYRDINQNRRMDLFFNPAIERKNIVYFLNFIKIDGYNPLVINGEKLFFKKEKALSLLKEFKINSHRLASLMQEGFHLGEFFRFLGEEGIALKRKDDLARKLVDEAKREPSAYSAEGYWIDHWRYNLDLIENFFYFYPDKWKDLFLSKEFSFWDDQYQVKERRFRYILKGSKVYQGKSIEADPKKQAIIEGRPRFKNFLRTKKGKIYRTNLVVKLLTLILNKSASLDPYGIGVEMEADRPGWCDSLNGLPALFGSSLSETLELKRACLVLIEGLKRLEEAGITSTTAPAEVFLFFNQLNKLLKDYSSSNENKRDYLWWDKANSLKEIFRKNTFFTLSGNEREIGIEKLKSFLQKLVVKLSKGIARAKDKKSNLYFTYFTQEVKKYKLRNNQIIPTNFKHHCLPLFLEAPVHILRVEKEKNIAGSLKKSPLFDKKLKMYRLNASLESESLEIGRSRAFVPGWLENESIWLHMEYKYLLEMLKAGLYQDFFRDFYKVCVCFFDPQNYGRNILENSSFIVSSAYPDQHLWQKGFVARLSGATAELLNIWIILCLGRKPFFLDQENRLALRFSPILEGKMFTTRAEKIIFKGKEVILPKDTFAFKLFSSILVVYHNPKRRDTPLSSTGKDCQAKKITVQANGREQTINSSLITSPLSDQIREVKVERIDIYL